DATICKGSDDDYIKKDEFYFKFKSWHAQNYGSKTCDNMKRFMEYMNKKLGKYNELKGWKGVKFVTLGEKNKDGDDMSNDLNLNNNDGIGNAHDEDEYVRDDEDASKSETASISGRRLRIKSRARAEENALSPRKINQSHIKIDPEM